MNAQYTEQPDPTRLKLATLMFDRIYFGGFVPDTVEELEFFGGETVSTGVLESLGSIWRDAGEAAPKYASAWPPGGGPPWKDAPDDLKSAAALAREEWIEVCYPGRRGDRDAEYDVYKLSVYTIGEAHYWRRNFGRCTLIGDRFAGDLLLRLDGVKPSSGADARGITPAIADLAPVSWKDVLDLRRSPYLSDFRNFYRAASLSADHRRLEDLYVAALEQLAGDVRPSVPEEAFVGVLSNIPFPSINPFGMAASTRAVRKARAIRKEYGWMFFLREVRQRRHSGGEDLG
jgi:hypothetical protein